MVYALTEASARAAEERAVAELDMTLADLMRRAGTAVARELRLRVPYGDVAILAGKGNNGGDGWVVSRELHTSGRTVTVYSAVAPESLEGIAGDAARDAIDAGVRVDVVEEMESSALQGLAAIVDAMFGIGFTGEVRAPYASWIEAVNASDATVFSVDLPSGVETDTGYTASHAVNADVTVTFSAPKIGILNYPGAGSAGDVVVADLGIPWGFLGNPGDLEIWEPADYGMLVPVARPDDHKNARGRVLIVAGSGAFPGAAALATLGAQRMGAGYVTVAVPEAIASIVQTKLTSAVVVGLPQNPSSTLASKVTDEILDVAREFDAVVVGPGMTVAHGAAVVARSLVKDVEVPLVLDADGLNAMVDAAETLSARTSKTVITPHPGELARLLDTTPAEIQSDRLRHGRALSGSQLTCVLKGAHTVVSGADRQVITLAGGPSLATAGTGDVLAGMIGALLAQGLEPFEAGALGAYLHGCAGDYAAAELTATCVIAEDVPDHLPHALKGLAESG
jgi:NAD(P)H-hydrate epimerase